MRLAELKETFPGWEEDNDYDTGEGWESNPKVQAAFGEAYENLYAIVEEIDGTLAEHMRKQGPEIDDLYIPKAKIPVITRAVETRDPAKIISVARQFGTTFQEWLATEEAQDLVSDLAYDERDQKDYDQDAYRHYGVRRSDF